MRAASKSPEAFRTISEVANDLDVPQHVLRFWETKFAQVKPLKRAGGRRYYRPEDLDLLRGIRTLLYTDGFTIKGVQKVLREQGVRYVMETGRMVGQADRSLPVTHTGSLEATTNPDLMIEEATTEPELTIEPYLETPIVSSQERLMAEEPIEAMQPVPEAGLSSRQRAALESILEELMELKFNLDGAKKTLSTGAHSMAMEYTSGSKIRSIA